MFFIVVEINANVPGGTLAVNKLYKRKQALEPYATTSDEHS